MKRDRVWGAGNKDETRWVATTAQPSRYGYAHEPVASIAKIAKILGKETP